MHIVVCIKQVADPEAPDSFFAIDQQRQELEPLAGVKQLMSPYDEQAVEAALCLRDGGVDATITALSLGAPEAEDVLRAALSMGADRGVLIAEAGTYRDAWSTALLLSAAVRELQADLVLTGRQAADTDAGVVGLGVAELLAFPAVTFAKALRPGDSGLEVDRALGDVEETVRVDLPALVAVTHELGQPRRPSLRDAMAGRRKPLDVWDAAELSAKAQRREIPPMRRERLAEPPRRHHCEIIEGDDAQTIALRLTRRLREAGVL